MSGRTARQRPSLETARVPARGQEVRKIGGFSAGDRVFHQKFGYGTVIIRGTGSSFEPLPLIDHPLEFRNYVTAG